MSIVVTLALAESLMTEPARLATVILLSTLGLGFWLRARRWVSGSTLTAAWAWIGVTWAAQSAAALATAATDAWAQSAWS
ncbi:MAG TPA: hypothetical protein VIK18_07350, partial [Pirellulales bacterium]